MLSFLFIKLYLYILLQWIQKHAHYSFCFCFFLFPLFMLHLLVCGCHVTDISPSPDEETDTCSERFWRHCSLVHFIYNILFSNVMSVFWRGIGSFVWFVPSVYILLKGSTDLILP